MQINSIIFSIGILSVLLAILFVKTGIIATTQNHTPASYTFRIATTLTITIGALLYFSKFLHI